MSLRDLEDSFPGDAAFSGLVDAFRGEWSDCSFRDELVEAVGDEGMAIVVFAAARDHALDWLHKPVPALEQRSPDSFLGTDRGRLIVSFRQACLTTS